MTAVVRAPVSNGSGASSLNTHGTASRSRNRGPPSRPVYCSGRKWAEQIRADELLSIRRSNSWPQVCRPAIMARIQRDRRGSFLGIRWPDRVLDGWSNRLRTLLQNLSAHFIAVERKKHSQH
uniref:(northern house mosquito) hypothetical protein n=1 Tax=Culex pipiens TaxID=7175 RepID=A0A8D8ABS2_CULPI